MITDNLPTIHEECNNLPELHGENINEELEKEAHNREQAWYLSFSKRSGWICAVVVWAKGFVTAVEETRVLNLNPGGEVKGYLLPKRDIEAAQGHFYKKLSKGDVSCIFGGIVDNKGKIL